MESVECRDFPTIGEYAVLCKLGGGAVSQSQVWKAEHRKSGQVVALKQIRLSNLTPHLKDCLHCAITFLSSVNHPNIIRLFDFFQAEDCIFLVLEFCDGGNLASYIHHHGRVQQFVAKGFIQQLAAGLHLLNSHQIIHRDLKPEVNLIWNFEREMLNCSFSDLFYYSGSRILNPDEYAETVCGTPFYMAPEVLQFQTYNEKVDMWSVGAILFELLNGYPPFCGRSNVQLLQNINSCTRLPFSDLILLELHPDCIDMCSRLLSINPGREALVL